jgi:hypothetical protein
VLVGFGDNVAWGQTLQDALDKVFKGESGVKVPDPNKQSNPPTNQTVQQALTEAQDAFARADAALRSGNLATYQSELAKAKAAIDRAVRASSQTPPSTPPSTPTSTPTPTPSPPATPGGTPTSPPAGR